MTLFENKAIFGMIHLAGSDKSERVNRALEEIRVYEQHGLTGAIVENYHGSVDDVHATLTAVSEESFDMHIGVNILSEPHGYKSSFRLADRFSLPFIQIDQVSGVYSSGTLDVVSYEKYRQNHPEVIVLGGVHPKYYSPLSPLEEDIAHAMDRAEAIVVTGQATGKETPRTRIELFRKHMDWHDNGKPLIVGAGVNERNAYEQLSTADGAIIGSAFKKHSFTHLEVVPDYVRRIMDAVGNAK